MIVLLGLLITLGWVSGLVAHPEHPPQAKLQRSPTKQVIKNFALTDQRGNPFEFEKLKGKVVVVGFGYTTCPDVCPLITAAMRSVQDGLAPAEKSTVYFLTITTDPEIDSPQVLAAYAKRYAVDLNNWSFLTGKEGELRGVWQSFGVKVQRKARGLVDHTALTVLVDQSGVMKFAYHGTAPEPLSILSDLRSLLKLAKKT